MCCWRSPLPQCPGHRQQQVLGLFSFSFSCSAPLMQSAPVKEFLSSSLKISKIRNQSSGGRGEVTVLDKAGQWLAALSRRPGMPSVFSTLRSNPEADWLDATPSERVWLEYSEHHTQRSVHDQFGFKLRTVDEIWHILKAVCDADGSTVYIMSNLFA